MRFVSNNNYVISKVADVNRVVLVFVDYKILCDNLKLYTMQVAILRREFLLKARVLKAESKKAGDESDTVRARQKECDNLALRIEKNKEHITINSLKKNKDFNGSGKSAWDHLGHSKATFYRLYKIYCQAEKKKKGDGRDGLLAYAKKCELKKNTHLDKDVITNNVLYQIMENRYHFQAGIDVNKIFKGVNKDKVKFGHSSVTYNMVLRIVEKAGFKDLKKLELFFDSRTAFKKNIKNKKKGYILFGDKCDPILRKEVDNLDSGPIYRPYKHG